MKYQIMFYGGLVLGTISLILAVISFFKLNAADAIRDLIGINIKKKSSSNKIIKSKQNSEKDKIAKGVSSKVVEAPINEVHGNGELDLQYGAETTFVDEEGTTFLEEEGTTFLEEEGTTFLEDDKGYSENYINEYNMILINTNRKI